VTPGGILSSIYIAKMQLGICLTSVKSWHSEVKLQGHNGQIITRNRTWWEIFVPAPCYHLLSS